MSTIYRYLDVLSVEKCIDNINDFIKIKRIFIIMSVMLYFLLYFALSKQKTYNMLDKKKYRLVTTANKVSVVTAYDSLKDVESYEDEFIDFCCLHILDFQVALFALNSRNEYVLRYEHSHKFKLCEIETTLDLS